MSFPSVEIGTLVEPVQTWNPSTRPQDNFQYLDLSSVDQTAKEINAPAFMVGEDAPSRARQLVRSGDILVSTVRPNLNGVAPVYDRFDGATASTGFCVLRPNQTKLDTAYLKHWVRCPLFVERMVREATGASYPAVSDRIVKASHIPLPPLAEQRRIAAILDRADALRRKRKRALDLLDSLIQSIFLELFSDKHNRVILPIGAVCSVSSGSTPRRDIAENYSGDIPWVKTTEVQGKIITSSDEKITESGFKGARLKLYPVGTVLIAMYGQGTTRGKVGMLGIEASTNQACAALVAGPKIIPLFLFHQLRQKYQDFRALGRGGNQPNLNGELVKNFDIFVPPLREQKAFVDFQSSIASRSAEVAASMCACDQLFISLQSRAFSGQL